MNGKIILPLTLLFIGIAWMLNLANVVPGVNWIWTGAIAVVGLLMPALDRRNRGAWVGGGFLLAGAICSVLRQTGRLSVDWEFATLLVILAALMLAAQFFPQKKSEKDKKP